MCFHAYVLLGVMLRLGVRLFYILILEDETSRFCRNIRKKIMH
jgi:hypothetical protein